MASYVDIEGMAYGSAGIDPRGDAGANATLSSGSAGDVTRRTSRMDWQMVITASGKVASAYITSVTSEGVAATYERAITYDQL